jgi:Ca2+-binding EF-hand superfamily protein
MMKYLVLAAAVASITAPSFAQQTPPTPEERAARFDAADKNKDGKLDKAEWITTLPEQAQAMADQIWGRVDADGDGSVTKEQYLALRMGPRPPQ